jgi:hypothetical protein
LACPDLIDHEAGVGAIADQIAQKDPKIGFEFVGMGQAGLEGFAVCVDVGEKGDAHFWLLSKSPNILPACNFFDKRGKRLEK